MTDHNLAVPPGTPLRRALEIIDAAGTRTVFVTGGDGVVIGLATDGDVRRGLLSEATLESPVSQVMQRNFRSAHVGSTNSQIARLFDERVTIVPVVDDAGRLVDFATPRRMRRVPMAQPQIGDQEIANVMECLSTNWISSKGRFISEFESRFADMLGVVDALAVTSGTAALHLALASAGVGPGDEVIVPDLTFAASANAVLHAGATPVLVDVSPDTWNVDPDAVAAALSPRTRAVMPVHLFGLAVDVESIRTVVGPGVLVVEDAAEALGAHIGGTPVGRLGDMAAFSFFGNKVITTGEGGMVTFEDADTATHARVLRDHGMSKERRYWHDHVGFNYRMTNLQAAVGVGQLTRVETFLQRRREVAARYRDELMSIHEMDLHVQQVDDGRVHAWWAFGFTIGESLDIDADTLVAELAVRGVEARRFFYPLSEMPPFAQMSAQYTTVARSVSHRGVCLPLFSTISDDQVTYVIDTVVETLLEAA